MSRFTFLDRPQALPGTCLICGTANAPGFVDTQRSLQWVGAVYCCSHCVQEMFAVLAFKGKPQSFIPEAMIGEIRNAVARFGEEQKNATSSFRDIRDYLSSIATFLESASEAIVRASERAIEDVERRETVAAGVPGRESDESSESFGLL